MDKHSGILPLMSWVDLFNTAFIERLNGTFRERLASLTRKCRHAVARMETLEAGMYLIGCTYNFCFPHQELSKKAHFGCPTTPALAAALTDHIWGMRVFLMYKVIPPWCSQAEPPPPKRPRGRPPKYILAHVLAAARAQGIFTS